MKNFFLTVLVILCACGSSDQPENLMTPEQMTKLLVEVHLLEAKVAEIPIVPLDSSQFVFDHFEKKLFDEMEITTDQYEVSFKYYLDHPKEFGKIYKAVVDSLLQKEKITAE